MDSFAVASVGIQQRGLELALLPSRLIYISAVAIKSLELTGFKLVYYSTAILIF